MILESVEEMTYITFAHNYIFTWSLTLHKKRMSGNADANNYLQVILSEILRQFCYKTNMENFYFVFISFHLECKK